MLKGLGHRSHQNPLRPRTLYSADCAISLFISVGHADNFAELQQLFGDLRISLKILRANVSQFPTSTFISVPGYHTYSIQDNVNVLQAHQLSGYTHEFPIHFESYTVNCILQTEYIVLFNDATSISNILATSETINER